MKTTKETKRTKKTKGMKTQKYKKTKQRGSERELTIEIRRPSTVHH